MSTLQPLSLVRLDACPICESRALTVLRRRIDGVAVLQCGECGMGFVEQRPADLRDFYGDEYYRKPDDAGGKGYGDYDAVAAHSLGWVRYLLDFLPGDRVLDVGCADGFLLRQLESRFKRSGVEVNAAMARKCEAAGIEIIGQDICDPALTASHAASFDVITAIAVLEHLVDLRGALQSIRTLLAPGGVLIFEVPLLSERHDNDIWFSSSLEHIYYPTIQGLNRIFAEVFGRPPIGGEVIIQQYGSVYTGMIAGDATTATGLGQLHARLFDGPVAGLNNEKEKVFRFFFDVIHAARTSPELVQLIDQVAPSDLSPALLARISFLWRRDAEVRAALAASQAAMAFHEQQSRNWQSEAEVQTRVNAELRDWIKKVEAARDGHAQRSNRLEEQLNRVTEELARVQSYWRQLQWKRRLKFFLRPGSVAR